MSTPTENQIDIKSLKDQVTAQANLISDMQKALSTAQANIKTLQAPPPPSPLVSTSAHALSAQGVQGSAQALYIQGQILSINPDLINVGMSGVTILGAQIKWPWVDKWETFLNQKAKDLAHDLGNGIRSLLKKPPRPAPVPAAASGTTATESAAAAKEAQKNAARSAAAAVRSNNTAERFAGLAETAKDRASTASTEAGSAKGVATTEEGEAAGAKKRAQSARDSARLAKNTAVDHADKADEAKVNAQKARDSARSARKTAEGHATAAKEAKDTAGKAMNELSGDVDKLKAKLKELGDSLGE